ncbi:unnamed protein product [Victoria cruziana]
MGEGWQNGMLRPSGKAELQQGAVGQVFFPLPFPQPLVSGASGMPLIQGALPLWPATLPQPVAPMNVNCRPPDDSADQSLSINMPIRPKLSGSRPNPGRIHVETTDSCPDGLHAESDEASLFSAEIQRELSSHGQPSQALTGAALRRIPSQ